jgi:hypothetical protein
MLGKKWNNMEEQAVYIYIISIYLLLLQSIDLSQEVLYKYIYKIKAVIRGGSQNYIVGVLWDIAIVLIF